MRERRNAYSRILVGTPEGKRPLARLNVKGKVVPVLN
jgi:hypothetical protein